jgi:hypothetical protein
MPNHYRLFAHRQWILLRNPPLFQTVVLTRTWYAQMANRTQVDPSLGGVIIPAFFIAYPLASTTSQGSTVAYARSFTESACFKWGYADNITVELKHLSDWQADAAALSGDAGRGWMARLTAVDIGGSLVQFEPVSAGGSGPTGVDSVAGLQHLQKTVSGCMCKPQWYTTSSDASGAPMVMPHTGCERLGEWPSPGCEVDAATCPPGAVLAMPPLLDYCAPQTTVDGCACRSSWSPGAGQDPLDGTCAPRDEQHPYASWCEVNMTTCPSGTRFQGSADASWSYCAQRTSLGCECANAWVDVKGR